MEDVLSRFFGGSVRIDSTEPLRESSVERLRIDGAPVATVIVKRTRDDALRNEWAGLRLLTELDLDPPLAPRFYGGDADAGVIVYEDLGEGDSLAEVLLGSDATRARNALFAWARALGRMHAATGDHIELYRELRGSPDTDEYASYRDGQARAYAAACSAIGLEAGAAVREDIETALRIVHEPGPYLAYTPGDVCPDNNRLVDGRAVLFDFTWGGVRHALTDAAYITVPMPTCWCVNALPDAVALELVDAYRSELPARDDFWHALVAASAVWTTGTTAASIPRSLLMSARWGISTHAQRLALRLPAFVRLARRTGEFSALASHIERVAERLGVHQFEMPLYPAFRA